MSPIAFRQVLRRMTPIQHGVLQLLLLRAQNEDIARIFERDLSTAKSYVSGLNKVWGLNRRAALVAIVAPLWAGLKEDEYRAFRGMSLKWGEESMAKMMAGERADLGPFVERRGRMKASKG